MKDILFRAKRIDNGKWVEGYYAYSGIVDRNYIITVRGTCALPPYNWMFIDIEIDKNTLCQYTGLTDKNGKLIWENDIVYNGNYFVVKWNLSCARFDFALNNSHNIPVGRWEPMIIDWRNSDFKEYRNNIDFEVIGNIFDNPELLEVGE